MKYKSLYIAATSQHVGKTTTTLGLLAALQNRGLDVGYSKPLGQQFLTVNGKRVDKDAVLFSNMNKGFELIPDIHSPVILGPGDTQELLEVPRPKALTKKILHAADVLRKNHQFVLYEGTGHPGVGSVVELSNARVAELLETEVVLVLEGGIGNTIDRLTLSKALFDAHNVRIAGVILNKVLRSKVDKIRRYVEPWVNKHGMELFGLIPFDEELVYPALRHVIKSVQGELVLGEDADLDNLVHGCMAGVDATLTDTIPSANRLLVVSRGRFHEALLQYKDLCKEKETDFNLAGVIVTSLGRLNSQAMSLCEENDIPVVISAMDTYQTVIHLDHLVAKIDAKSPTKIKRAISLVEENVDLDKILEIFD